MLDDSEALQRRIVAARRRTMGEEHFRTLEAHFHLACILVLRQKFDEARELQRRVLPVARRVLGPDDEVTRGLASPDFLEPSRYQ